MMQNAIKFFLAGVGLAAPLVLLTVFAGCAVVFVQGMKEEGSRLALRLAFLFSVTFALPCFLVWLYFREPLDLEPFLRPAAIVYAAFALAVSAFFYIASRRCPEKAAWRLARKAGLWNAAAAFSLVFYLALFLPKMVALLRVSLDGRNLAALASLRERVEDYRRQNGAYPSDLSFLGDLPELNIWAETQEGEPSHHHPPGREAVLLPGISQQELDVSFVYRSEKPVRKILLLGNFSGSATRKNIMLESGEGAWSMSKILAPGRYRYGFVVDGRRRESVQEEIVYPMRENSRFIRSVRPIVRPGDEGKWGYDPRTGYVFIACTGNDHQAHRPLYAY